MAIRYTRRADPSGWLKVRLSGSGGFTSLPEYTEVKIGRKADGRTYFTIVDGFIAVGQEASMKDDNAAKYLSAVGPGPAALLAVQYQGAPAVEYSRFFRRNLTQQWAKLDFNGHSAIVTLNSVWDQQFTPIPKGTHAILAPDYSHHSIPTGPYVAATPGMVGNDVWFPIGLFGHMVNSSRYVHVGHLSEGCVTVHQIEQWSTLYNYLISHRAPGTHGKRIGSLVVR